MKKNIIFSVITLCLVLSISQYVLSLSDNTTDDSSSAYLPKTQSVYSSIYSPLNTPILEDPFVMHQIVVKFKDNSISEQDKENIRQNLKITLGLEKLEKKSDIEDFNAQIWQLGLNDDVYKVLSAFENNPAFEYAHFNFGIRTAVSDNKEKSKFVFTLQSPFFDINGTKKEIDPGRTTVPQIVNGRTVLPIRAFIESIGGTVNWVEKESKVTIQYQNKNIELVIGKSSAIVDGNIVSLDVPPIIITGRTMVPLRFISENLGFNVQWMPESQEIIIQN